MARTFTFKSDDRVVKLVATLGDGGFRLQAFDSDGGTPKDVSVALMSAPEEIRDAVAPLLLVNDCDRNGIPNSKGSLGETAQERVRSHVIGLLAEGKSDKVDRALRNAVPFADIEQAGQQVSGVINRIFRKDRRQPIAAACERIYSATNAAKNSSMTRFLHERTIRSAYAELERLLGDDFAYCGFPSLSTENIDPDKRYEKIACHAIRFSAGTSMRQPYQVVRDAISRRVATGLVDSKILPLALEAWEKRAVRARAHETRPDMEVMEEKTSNAAIFVSVGAPDAFLAKYVARVGGDAVKNDFDDIRNGRFVPDERRQIVLATLDNIASGQNGVAGRAANMLDEMSRLDVVAEEPTPAFRV